MTDDPTRIDVEAAFAPLLGLPCWNVKPGYGSFLTLEFGEPHLKIREPREVKSGSKRVRELLARRNVHVRGQWHLWIYCCEWEVYSGKKRVGHSDLKASGTKWIERGARELDGQKLTGVRVKPKSGNSVFTFDLGSRLETKPYNRRSEQWLLYEPDGRVLTYRADGLFSHHPVDLPDGKEVWRPMHGGS
jgi:hypothetical protein